MRRFFVGSAGNDDFFLLLLIFADLPMILVTSFIKIEYLAPGFRTILVEIAYIHNQGKVTTWMPTVSKITVGLIADKLALLKSLENIASLGALMNLIVPLLKIYVIVL